MNTPAAPTATTRPVARRAPGNQRLVLVVFAVGLFGWALLHGAILGAALTVGVVVAIALTSWATTVINDRDRASRAQLTIAVIILTLSVAYLLAWLAIVATCPEVLQ